MAQDDSPYFHLRQADDVAVIEVQVREIRQPASAQEFGSDVALALQQCGAKRVLIDLRDTEYLGSTAFATLLNLARNLRNEGGVLKLSGLHPDVHVGGN